MKNYKNALYVNSIKGNVPMKGSWLISQGERYSVVLLYSHSLHNNIQIR